MTTRTDGAPRPRNPLEYEEGFWGRGVSLIAGVDEVGRGPLAGPVLAAAVILRVGDGITGADDSKRLGAARRAELAREIRTRARAVGIGAASVREIDRLDIARATALAMNRALRSLGVEPEHVVVDGLPVRGLSRDHAAVVRGDALVHSIACASIVAKVLRDELMCSLARRYPGYGWERNKGYGTREHLRALASRGRSPHHRVTFGAAQIPLPLPDGAVPGG